MRYLLRSFLFIPLVFLFSFSANASDASAIISDVDGTEETEIVAPADYADYATGFADDSSGTEEIEFEAPADCIDYATGAADGACAILNCDMVEYGMIWLAAYASCAGQPIP